MDSTEQNGIFVEGSHLALEGLYFWLLDKALAALGILFRVFFKKHKLHNLIFFIAFR